MYIQQKNYIHQEKELYAFEWNDMIGEMVVMLRPSRLNETMIFFSFLNIDGKNKISSPRIYHVRKIK